METSPHHNSLIVEKRGEREPQHWSHATEALLLLQELASVGAPKRLLGSRVAQFIARATNSKMAAVFWLQANQKELLCEEPYGAGPLRVSPQDPFFAAALRGAPTTGTSGGFASAVPIDGADGVVGLVACSADSEALPPLRFFASLLSSALLQQREIPRFVREFLQAKNPIEAIPAYFQALLQSINRERGGLFIQDPDGSLRTLYSNGISENFLQNTLRLYPQSAAGIAKAILEPIQVEDTLLDARIEATRPFLQRESIRSYLVVPVVYQSEPVIGFTVYSDEPGGFSAREVARARALGLLMAPVLVAAQAQSVLQSLPVSVFYQNSSNLTKALNPAALHPKEAGEIVTRGLDPSLSLVTKTPFLQGQLLTSQALPKEAKPSGLLLSASRALRDPLTVIWGYLGMIEGRMRRSNPQDTPRMERLQSSLHRLTQLSDELFDLAQNSPANVQTVDVSMVLASVARELGVEPQSGPMLCVKAEPNKLTKALLLLAKLVARFTKDSDNLPEVRVQNDEVLLHFALPSSSPEQNFRLEESLGISGVWLSMLAKQWGGSFQVPSQNEGALCLSLRKA